MIRTVLTEIEDEIAAALRRCRSFPRTPGPGAPTPDPMLLGLTYRASFRPGPDFASLLRLIYGLCESERELEPIAPKSLSVAFARLTPYRFVDAGSVSLALRAELATLVSRVPTNWARLASLKLLPQRDSLWVVGVPPLDWARGRIDYLGSALEGPRRDEVLNSYDEGPVPPLLWGTRLVRWRGGAAPTRLRSSFEAWSATSLGSIELAPPELVLENASLKIREPFAL